MRPDSSVVTGKVSGNDGKFVIENVAVGDYLLQVSIIGYEKTDRRVNVPVIPRLSVINTYGSWIVFIIDQNNIARRREVILGIENEEFIEVQSGIKLGDRVVSAGQNFLSDGDLVRIVD